MARLILAVTTYASGAPARALGGALRPLDSARRWVLRAFGPVSRRLVADRELRVAALGVAIVGVAFGGAVLLPFWMLALGPLTVGVLHLLADVRYLVVRPGYHRRPELVVAVGVPLLAAATVGTVHAVCAAVVGAALMARGALWKRLFVVGAVAPLWAWAAGVVGGGRGAGWEVAVVLAHLHNVLAIGLWWGWRQRERRLHWVPLVAVVIGAAWILAGPLPSTVYALGPDALGELARIPGLSPRQDGRFLLLFAFGQAVHYGVWVHLVPNEDRRQPTTRSFRGTWKALVADFGVAPLLLTIALCFGLAAWAVADLTAAHSGYFRMGAFHVPLEVAVLALWLTEGRPR